MKLPITDQFLWDIYNFIEDASDVAYFVFRRRRTMRDIFPENPILKKYSKMVTRHQFSKLVYRLKRNNLIKSKNLKGKKAIMITPEGMERVLRISFKVEDQKRKKRNDGKWIMLIFDIPKRDSRKRGLLRAMLRDLGYKVFQKSVWVTPYDVSDRTEKFLQFYALDQYVRLLLVEKM
ncbi:MAG: hypothetical protein AAB340_03515 [Patescibacteria group bacterium]